MRSDVNALTARRRHPFAAFVVLLLALGATGAVYAVLAPTSAEGSVSDQSLAIDAGREIFRTNCASCHNFAANGGALTYGKYAVSITKTSPKHIYEAMLTGPQA